MRKVNVSDLIAKAKLNGQFIAIFTVCLLVIVFNGYNQYVYGSALPSMMADTGISPTTLGSIATATLFGMFLGSLAFGMIADRIGRVKAMIFGTALFCIADGLFGSATSPAMFAVLRVIAGFGIGGVVPIVIPTVSEYSPVKNRATLSTWVTMGVPIGAIITPLLFISLLPKVGWRNMYRLCFIPLIIIIFIIMIVPESMERLCANKENDKIVKILKRLVPEFQPQQGDVYETASRAGGKAKSSVKDLVSEGRALTTILFWITFFCSMLFTYGLATWLPNIMMEAGFSVNSSLTFVFVYALGSLPFTVLATTLASKIGSKKATALLMAIAAISLALLAFNPPTPVMYLLLFCTGGGMYGETAIFYSYISLSYPNSVRSTGVGFAAAVGRIGGMAGPTIGGILSANGASLTLCFFTFAAFMAVAAVCVCFTQGQTAE